MPYVNVPNDLSKIKTKMAFNLTKRQLVCFGSAGAVGIPAYLLTRGTLGNTGAMFLMLGIMLPAFLLAMYGQSALYILIGKIRSWSRRYYKSMRILMVIAMPVLNVTMRANCTDCFIPSIL